MTVQSPAKYLPGLDAIRLYAALAVVAEHTLGTRGGSLGLLPSGWNAVTIFFVLSGYLITYRLLVEQRNTGSIDLRSFYIRRELRILPLYYLLLLVGAVILPLFGAPTLTPASATAVLLLVPQVPHSFGWPLGVIGSLWSIGVEEMFYFAFPWLIKRFSCPRVAIAIFVASVAISAYLNTTGTPFGALAREMRFDCIVIGALAAWLVVSRSRWLFVIYHKAIQVASLVLILTACSIVSFDSWRDAMLSIGMAILLINVSTNPKSLIKLDFPGAQALGALTYGIYIWHYPILWIIGHWLSGLPQYMVVVVGAIAFAAFSHRFFERPFLRLKDRFEPHSPQVVAVSASGD